MPGGAFLTSREVFSNPIWQNIVEFRLFFLIYGNAVFSEEGVRVADDLVLQRGQWLRSTRKLQEDLKFIENRQVKTYSTATINRTIQRLVKLQRICTKQHQLGTVFTVLNYEMYQAFGEKEEENLERNLEHSRNNNKNVYKGINKKDIYSGIHEKIIAYLNEKTGKRYSSKVKRTRDLINGRLSEGRTFEDFVYVIDTKCSHWLDDPKMFEYLRPDTLFRPTNFDKYLNQLPREEEGRDSYFESRDKEVAFQQWVEEGNDPDEFDWS
ncbi:conserved phage C-terminal domain-containing protein [Paenibacillus cisolokensis]|uniref:conserved phage C-terminal domain-containing protein n=1 Tax=Paenibacillus cisolokensis TaxID=1658519 RepID=UPI003D2974D3